MLVRKHPVTTHTHEVWVCFFTVACPAAGVQASGGEAVLSGLEEVLVGEAVAVSQPVLSTHLFPLPSPNVTNWCFYTSFQADSDFLWVFKSLCYRVIHPMLILNIFWHCQFSLCQIEGKWMLEFLVFTFHALISVNTEFCHPFTLCNEPPPQLFTMSFCLYSPEKLQALWYHGSLLPKLFLNKLYHKFSLMLAKFQHLNFVMLYLKISNYSNNCSLCVICTEKQNFLSPNYRKYLVWINYVLFWCLIWVGTSFFFSMGPLGIMQKRTFSFCFHCFYIFPQAFLS